MKSSLIKHFCVLSFLFWSGMSYSPGMGQKGRQEQKNSIYQNKATKVSWKLSSDTLYSIHPSPKLRKHSFCIPVSEYTCLLHISVLLQKGSKVLEINNLKLHMTWNVIRNCKPTKTEHIQQKNDNQLPTWTTIYWLKQRQSITSHHPP